MPDPAPPRLLPRREVLRLLNVSNTTLYNWIREGVFPQPVILNPGRKFSRLAWREDEVSRWIDQRPRGNGSGFAPAHYAKMTTKADERRAAAPAARKAAETAAFQPTAILTVEINSQDRSRPRLKPLSERRAGR